MHNFDFFDNKCFSNLMDRAVAAQQVDRLVTYQPAH